MNSSTQCDRRTSPILLGSIHAPVEPYDRPLAWWARLGLDELPLQLACAQQRQLYAAISAYIKRVQRYRRRLHGLDTGSQLGRSLHQESRAFEDMILRMESILSVEQRVAWQEHLQMRRFQ